MKSIVISSNSSGGGKTTLTLGLMKAIIKRGFEVQGYKAGPDYIDPAFHKHVTDKASRNLDLYLMGEAGVKASYSRGTGEFGVIEGVMGLYDGKGVDSEYSTAHLAKLLKLPIVLVITPKAQSVTLCAEINGILNFEDSNIVGVILNNINGGYYKLLKAAIEKNCSPNLKVFGYLPKDERLELKSRHLGLVQSSEVKDLDKKIESCSQLLEDYVDIDSLLSEFMETEEFQDDFHRESIGLKIAVAQDKAFNFYYKENMELLEEYGTVEYFSPLKDKKLPENIDFLYLGGGYPEVFISELSNNKSMLNSIKNALDNGLKCYAECGGLMYLTNSIEGKGTVGFFKGEAHMATGLQNFGYAQLTVVKDNSVVKQGLTINCHEFHKSFVDMREETVCNVDKISFDGGLKQWNCGYLKNNTMGTYAHIHFFGNMKFIESMLD
ncbi:MAG: cobyrinate a,c-diamide synthase [Clostridiaceae bacterium]|nr:cobyrinate a,c-diamide synthase [Clostridiaceae bacterium]